jgi:hypothetical protein
MRAFNSSPHPLNGALLDAISAFAAEMPGFAPRRAMVHVFLITE